MSFLVATENHPDYVKAANANFAKQSLSQQEDLLQYIEHDLQMQSEGEKHPRFQSASRVLGVTIRADPRSLNFLPHCKQLANLSVQKSTDNEDGLPVYLRGHAELYARKVIVESPKCTIINCSRYYLMTQIRLSLQGSKATRGEWSSGVEAEFDLESISFDRFC